MRAAVHDYLRQARPRDVPGFDPDRPFTLGPLAQGEYNVNMLLRQGAGVWVFRVNRGSQLGLDAQIRYEYDALRLIEGSGRTPRAYHCDDSRDRLPWGVLIMEYLPGEPLDYGRDLEAAGRLFADIHGLGVGHGHLQIEDRPLSQTWEECARLLPVYLEWEQADPAIASLLHEVLAWADEARHAERLFTADPWPCVINTEVNSGNFIADRARGTLRLVDWEKPLWGDPSQDLSHFGVATTTLWKTRTRLGPRERRALLDAWRATIPDAHIADTIEERVRLREPFNLLRGISWSAMAQVRYRSGEHALRNADTARKLDEYMNLDFIRGLFAPHMGG